MDKYTEIMDYITQDKFMIPLGIILIINLSLNYNEFFIPPIILSIQLAIMLWLMMYYVIKRKRIHESEER